MARVVEAVAADYSDLLRWEIVVTKKIDGAVRHAELSKSLGRPAPVPSIIMNGELVFESIPSIEDLRARLEQYLSDDSS